MTINWSQELDRVHEATKPISVGTHQFRITEAKPTKSSAGAPMIRLVCRVDGGPDDGKTAYVNLVFTFDNPRAMKMTLRRLSGLGISEETLKAENLSIEQIAARLIGRSAAGKVEHRDWNGETQSDVDFMGAGSTPGVVAPPVTAAPAATPSPAADVATPPTPVVDEKPF